MIIPFILEITPGYEAKYLVEFYRFLTFCKQKNWPLIAQEEYFKSPLYFAEKERLEAFSKLCADLSFYDIPTEEDFNNITACPIPQRLVDDFIQKHGNSFAASVALFQEPIPSLSTWLEKQLDYFENKTGEPIEAFITFREYPFLTSVLKKKGIPVFYYDIGTFRNDVYQQTVYLDFHGFLHNTEIETRYQNFLQEMDRAKIPIFTRKELLSIFLTPAYKSNITLIDSEPEFEVGIAAQMEDFPVLMSHQLYNNLAMIDQVANIYPKQQILIRPNNNDLQSVNYQKLKFPIDTSPRSFEFICRCKHVVSYSSNIAFEAMLWGKTAYALEKSPYYFISEHHINNREEHLVDLTFLNFVSFCFYVPYALLNNVEYLRWRLSKPTEIEIYLYHLKYFLDILGIEESTAYNPKKNRLENLLSEQGFNLLGEQIFQNHKKYKHLKNTIDRSLMISNESKKNLYLQNQLLYLTKSLDDSRQQILKLQNGIKYHVQHDKELNATIEWYKTRTEELQGGIEYHVQHDKELNTTIEWYKTRTEELQGGIEYHVQHDKELNATIEWYKTRTEELQGGIEYHVQHDKELNATIEWYKTHINTVEEENRILLEKNIKYEFLINEQNKIICSLKKSFLGRLLIKKCENNNQ